MDENSSASHFRFWRKMRKYCSARFGSGSGLTSAPNEFLLCGAGPFVKRTSAQVALAWVPPRSACRRWRAGASLGEDAGCREEASCERTQFVGSLVESEDICKVIGLAAPQHFPLAKDLHEVSGMSLIVNRLALFPMREGRGEP